ncbi:MAG TPA: hypothetical protein VF799_02305 [Geobacteraceae bacterium]
MLPVFICLTAAIPASATSVVCIRTPEAIAVAADSRLASRGDDSQKKVEKDCKIVQAGDSFFSMTGFVKDPLRPYDAVRIVREALLRNVPPHGPEAALTGAIETALREELQRLRAEAPDLYLRFIKGQTGTLLKVLLAGFEGGTPKMVLLGFRERVSPAGEINIAVERESCPGTCDPRGVNALVLGDRRPIDSFLRGGKIDFRTPEKAASFMVQLVIDANTPDVGPPVDVLRIDGGGARWIEKKEECPEIISVEP